MQRTHAVVEGINPEIAPSGTGCVECLKTHGSMWLHLRRCAECGHIGCCDDSPNRHARKHNHDTSHPIIQSFEREDEGWFYSYETKEIIHPGVTLKAPHYHPEDQPVPFHVR